MVDDIKERIEKRLNDECDECGQRGEPLVRSCLQCNAAICPECVENKEHWHRSTIKKQSQQTGGPS